MFNDKRNPLVNIDGINIQFIGDVHFGRKFLNTKSSRIGEREAMIAKHFKSLLNSKSDIVIIVGDLFDKFVVSPSVVLFVYDLLYSVFENNKDKTCYIIPGNHDLSRDSTKASSYKLLSIMLSSVENIKMVYDKPLLFPLSSSTNVLLDAYNPFYEDNREDYDNTLSITLEDHTEPSKLIYVGHWDDPRFNKGYLPSDVVLSKSNVVCVSGHVHIPYTTIYNNTPFYCIGSMQPYSFGEDPEEQLYLKFHYKDLESIIKKNPKTKDYKNKYIKINCRKGYVFPYPLDCISLVYNVVYEDIVEQQKVETKDFDFTSVYLKMLEESKVSEDIITSIKDKINNNEVEVIV